MTVENTMNIRTDDKEDAVLLYIHQGKTIRWIATKIHKSIRTIQITMQALEDKGLIENKYHKKSGRTLTTSGRLRLGKVGLDEAVE